MKVQKDVIEEKKANIISILNDIANTIGRKDFCEKTGMKAPNVAVLLKGEKFYTVDKLAEIADALGVKIDLQVKVPAKFSKK